MHGVWCSSSPEGKVERSQSAPPEPVWRTQSGPESPRRGLSCSKTVRLVAFVRMSNKFPVEGMRSTRRTPSRTLSRMEWYFARKCFVFECHTLSWDNRVVASLSQYNCVGGHSSPSALRTRRPWSSSRRKIASWEPVWRAMYSA